MLQALIAKEKGRGRLTPTYPLLRMRPDVTPGTLCITQISESGNTGGLKVTQARMLRRTVSRRLLPLQIQLRLEVALPLNPLRCRQEIREPAAALDPGPIATAVPHPSEVFLESNARTTPPVRQRQWPPCPAAGAPSRAAPGRCRCRGPEAPPPPRRRKSASPTGC